MSNVTLTPDEKDELVAFVELGRRLAFEVYSRPDVANSAQMTAVVLGFATSIADVVGEGADGALTPADQQTVSERFLLDIGRYLTRRWIA